MLDWIRKSTKLFLIASLTLGLGPFVPEPHIFGKMKWILGGAEGMQLMDWLDFLMHGTPWILLIFSLVLKLMKANKSDPANHEVTSEKVK